MNISRRDVLLAAAVLLAVIGFGVVAELVEDAVEGDAGGLAFADMADNLVVALLAGVTSAPVFSWQRRTQQRTAALEGAQRELAVHHRAEAASRARVAETRARVESLADGGGLSIHLQPIFHIDATTGVPVGFEALSRFPDGRSPDAWFTEAAAVGLGLRLEMVAVRDALVLLPMLPRSAYLSVNVSPDTLVSDDFWLAVRDHEGERIVVELTEHVHITDYDKINRVLARLRKLGVRIAVDDAGAGFSSLRHIIQLGPDLIKLDRDLIRRCDVDAVRRTLAQSLAIFARRIGAHLVAEGVETAEELGVLRTIDVENVQGYLLARPAPARQVVETYAERAAEGRAGGRDVPVTP